MPYDDDPTERARDVELAMATLDILDIDRVAEWGAEAADMVKWSVAVLWLVSGSKEAQRPPPRIAKLLLNPKGFAWADVIEASTPFLDDMEKRIEKQRQRYAWRHRPKPEPLLDDELPF